jgi:hypothetical protein
MEITHKGLDKKAEFLWLVCSADYFVPEIKKYCNENNVAFNVLLILDQASANGLNFVSVCPNINLVLFPPHTTSVMQPMDQWVISVLKACMLCIL